MIARAAGTMGLLGVGVVLGAAPAAADVSGPEIVSFLNAQRSAHAVPAEIVHDAALSDGCAKHNTYGQLNRVLIHDEEEGKSGYTAEGRQAARTSVLYNGGGPWGATRNPFETAPIHLHQLLAPRLDRMGASENQGWGCATTLASRARPAPPADVTYTYPGNGTKGWTPSQRAAEGPYTPGERVGIPAGTTTGPYLYVMFDGPGLSPFSTAKANSAALTGPQGAVDIAFVDNTTSGLENYLPTGMQLIPRAPLRRNTTYTASVAATITPGGGGGPPRTFNHTWSFTTVELANAIRITGTSANARQVRVSVDSTAPGATVAATGPGTAVTQPVNGGVATLDLDADGTWKLCARSGGTNTSEHAAAEQCADVTVAAPPPVVVPVPAPRPLVPLPAPPKTTATALPFTLTVPASARRGRAFTVRITSRPRFSVRYRVSAGKRTIHRSKSRSFAGGKPATLRVRLPARVTRRLKTVRLTLVVTVAGKPYTVVRTVTLR